MVSTRMRASPIATTVLKTGWLVWLGCLATTLPLRFGQVLFSHGDNSLREVGHLLKRRFAVRSGRVGRFHISHKLYIWTPLGGANSAISSAIPTSTASLADRVRSWCSISFQ